LIHSTARDWTRFSVPREQMGREAVRLLLELLDSGSGLQRQVYLDCIQVPGDSVSEPPAGRARPKSPHDTSPSPLMRTSIGVTR